jgi:hypothetical protein
MYEKYFRRFVAFLFPNDLLDESILDFLEGELTMDDAAAYSEKFGVDLFRNDDTWIFMMSLLNVLDEMKKDHPKKDLIEYHLDDALKILRNFSPRNLDKMQSFRTFLLTAESSKACLESDDEGIVPTSVLDHLKRIEMVS